MHRKHGFHLDLKLAHDLFHNCRKWEKPDIFERSKQWSYKKYVSKVIFAVIILQTISGDAVISSLLIPLILEMIPCPRHG